MMILWKLQKILARSILSLKKGRSLYAWLAIQRFIIPLLIKPEHQEFQWKFLHQQETEQWLLFNRLHSKNYSDLLEIIFVNDFINFNLVSHHGYHGHWHFFSIAQQTEMVVIQH